MAIHPESPPVQERDRLACRAHSNASATIRWHTEDDQPSMVRCAADVAMNAATQNGADEHACVRMPQERQS